jgi:hypothetical protein
MTDRKRAAQVLLDQVHDIRRKAMGVDAVQGAELLFSPKAVDAIQDAIGGSEDGELSSWYVDAIRAYHHDCSNCDTEYQEHAEVPFDDEYRDTCERCGDDIGRNPGTYMLNQSTESTGFHDSGGVCVDCFDSIVQFVDGTTVKNTPSHEDLPIEDENHD